MPSNLVEKLKDSEYRRAYVNSQITVGVPFQVRALRKQEGMSQEQLAKEAGMLQPRISAIEKPGKGKLNLDTLERIAAAFDVGLIVRFAPFSELISWSDDFDPDNFIVPTFMEELSSATLEPPVSHGPLPHTLAAVGSGLPLPEELLAWRISFAENQPTTIAQLVAESTAPSSETNAERRGMVIAQVPPSERPYRGLAIVPAPKRVTNPLERVVAA